MATNIKTIVITGATSFVGMHLCEAFNNSGWRVIALHSKKLSKYQHPQSHRISKISNIVEFKQFDINDETSLLDITKNYSPSLWIQHAGHAYNYASSNYDLKKGLKTNALSTQLLFKVLSNSNCGVILTGSAAEYGPSKNPHRENEISYPTSLYGATKLTQTIIAYQQSSYYNIPTRVARLFLPFGSLDNPKKLISLVTKALEKNEPINLSKCIQKRDFIGIDDVCDAYIRLAADLNRGKFDIFNICSGEPFEIKKFLTILVTAMNSSQSLLKFDKLPMREGEPHIIYGSNKKASALLAWKPSPLNTAIEKYVNSL